MTDPTYAKTGGTVDRRMLSFRVTPAQRAAIEKKAAESGRSVGQTIKDAVLPTQLNLHVTNGGPTRITGYVGRAFMPEGYVSGDFAEGVLYATRRQGLWASLRSLLGRTK